MTRPLTVHFPVLGTHVEVEILDYRYDKGCPASWDGPEEMPELELYRWRIGGNIVDMADHNTPRFWDDLEVLTELAWKEIKGEVREPDYGPDDL